VAPTVANRTVLTHTPSPDATDATSRAGKENRADLCYAFRCRQRMWQTWRAYVAKEKLLKKKLAKEEKERLKRAKENAKKRASRDRLKEQEQAAKEAAAAEKRSKEPPKPKKRRAFAAGDVFRSRVTAGHKVIEEEKVDLGENLCGNQHFTARSRWIVASTSTPSTRRLLDGVAMPVPRRSTEPGQPRHRREMT